MRAQLAAGALIALAGACAGQIGDDPSGSSEDDLTGRMPPANTIPCNHPEYWRYGVKSTSLPLRVHYMRTGDKAMAQQVLASLEHAWRVEVDEQGWRPPPSDGGACGSDGAFDVFLWRGHSECYVDVIGDAPGAGFDARIGYMVVDPWGPYGGPILDSTLAHEFNHACQMADDWSDCAIVYEMTADFMQKIVVPSDENYREYFADFQAHPDWSLDRDDGYKTWYSYGASLYLFYLRDRFFGGDPRFVSEMWLRLRGDASFEQALDGMLRERGQAGFLDSTLGFARWRWSAQPRVASTRVPAQAGRIDLAPAPMVLGSAYIQVAGTAGQADLSVSLSSSAPVRWVVQAVPGLDGSDGETLDLSHGAAPLRFAADGTRTLIVTALPADPAAYDPARKHDTRQAATLILR